MPIKEDFKTDLVGNEDITWLVCAGPLEVFSKLGHKCQNLLDKLKSVENVDVLTFALEARSLAEEGERLSKITVKHCSVVIEQEENRQTAIGCPTYVDDSVLISRDPGERPKTLNKDQKKFLISAGPHQPKLMNYPKNDSISRHKTCQFNPKWYESFPHLEYSINPDKAYCFVCSIFPVGPGREKSDTAWIDGIASWHKMKSVGTGKKGKLAQHFSSEADQAALADFARFSVEQGHIDIQMNRHLKDIIIQEKADEEKCKSIMKILFDIARTLARQGIAFRGTAGDQNGNFVQFVNLLSRHCPQMKEWLDSKRLKPYSTKYMSPNSQNELLEILGENVRERIKDEIECAKMLSVSADTTPDVSNMDQMVVAARYIGEKGIARERVVEMKECNDKHGDKTAECILKCLEANEINVNYLCFQTYDFANNMSGRIAGAQRVLQDILERPVPYIPCQGHRSNTFNEHCAKQSAIITSMYDNLQDIYVFFNASSKRNKIYNKEVQEVDEYSLKLRNISKTRWVYSSESIEAVWRSLQSIPKAIDKVVSDDSTEIKVKVKGNGIKKKCQSFDFLFALVFMRLIMKKTKILTMQLQAEELNILDAMKLIEATVENLKKIRIDNKAMDAELDAINECAKQHGIDSAAEFSRKHRLRLQPRKIDNGPETSTEFTFNSFYRTEMCVVLDSLITEYGENIKACLKKIEPLAMALQPPLKTISPETVHDLCKLFPPGFHIEADVILCELDVFRSMIEQQQIQPTSVKDAAKFSFENRRLFPTVYKCYSLLLTAPVFVAKDERTFSKLKIVKNSLRSRMKDERLNDLILLACEKDLTDTIPLDVVLKVWHEKK